MSDGMEEHSLGLL